MTNLTTSYVDLVCSEHNVPLEAPHQVIVLYPTDPSDFSQGWGFNLDGLDCPKDKEGECCDSWEVRGP